MLSSKRTFQIAVVLVLSVAAVANAGYLRSHVGVGSDCPDDVNNTDPCNGTKVSVEPAKNSKFITPEITEEKYYNRDTGLFMIHKLTSQEAQSIKAKIEPGIKEPKAQSEKTQGGKRPENGNGTSAAAAKDGGFGEVEELVKHNEQVLMEHHKHKEKMNDRVSKTNEMIEKVKKQLESLRAKEDKLRKEHRRYDIHSKIAKLVKEKRALDAKIQNHAAKLKVLDAERKQLDTQQKDQVVSLEGLKSNLNSVHLKIVNLKKALGLNADNAATGIADAEAAAEKRVEENADKAISGAGKKVEAEAKAEEEEEEAAVAPKKSSTGSATGAATGAATGSTGSSTGAKADTEGSPTGTDDTDDEDEASTGATGATGGKSASTDDLADYVEKQIKATQLKLKEMQSK